MDAGESQRYKSLTGLLHSESTAWAILGLALALTGIGWFISKNYIENRAEERFQFEVEGARQRILERMRNYEQVLHGGVAFLKNLNHMATRAEWHGYVSTLRLPIYFPGIQGVGVSVMLQPAALPAHINAVRAEGFPNYRVLPEGKRDLYSAIIYLEPFDWRNQRAFGYDMFSEPVRRAAMEQARDSNAPAISGRVTLVQETTQDVQSGFLVYVPFYANNKPIDTVAQRRAALLGYVYSPFRMHDLMLGILGSDPPDLGFEIYDGTNIQAGQHSLYRTDSRKDATVIPALRTQVVDIDLPGRIWTVRFYSRSTFDAVVASNQPWLIAGGGLIVDLLIFITIWSLAREQRRVQTKAEAMTVDLRHIISIQHQAEERLRLDANVFHYAHEGIVITDVEKRIVDINPMFTDLTGYSRDEAIGQTPKMLSSDYHDQGFYAQMWTAIRRDGHWRGEVWNRRKNGSLYAELLTVSAIRNHDAEPTHYVGVFSDITALKQQQLQLEHMAHYDALTHLPNRVLLAYRMELDMAHASRNGHLLGVCYLDLDGFKQVNDRYGHDIGDQLLIQVGNRMNGYLRPGDSLARLGGDEFVLLIGDLGTAHECEIVLTRLLRGTTATYTIDDNEIVISASVGVTLFPDDDSDADTLLRHADQAMYQAKETGRGRFMIFDPEQNRQTRAYLDTIIQIEDALVAEEFVLYYQPKVDMRLGVVLGAEALLRWNNPKLDKILLPGEFLPKVEQTAFAIHLGNWVLNTALRQLAIWGANNFTTVISVNISGQHLQQDGFVQNLRAMLERYPTVLPSQLELEVLETTALKDLATASKIIKDCQNLGVSVAIDDFGTGYSSLIYLKRLPADILKVDQSFVLDMLGDTESLAIIEGIVGLSQAVHRKVIAEGVESEEHGVALLGLGCDLGQGYAIARPMPAAEFPEWVSHYTQHQAWTDAAQQFDLVHKATGNGSSVTI